MGVSRNIFIELLNSDSEETFQPKGTYTESYAKRIIQRDDGSWAVKSIDGTERIFNLPLEGYMVIGAISDGKNRLYLFSTDNVSSGGDGEIGYIDLLPNTDGTGFNLSDYYMLYSLTGYSDSLNFTALHLIYESMIKHVKENDGKERIYWTDNYNKPRSINIGSEALAEGYGLNGLTTGETYMVLGGTVFHNSNVYGPGTANGSVFTAANANYTWLTVLTNLGTRKVIRYVPPEQLEWHPTTSYGTIHCAGEAAGGILTGGNYTALFCLLDYDGNRTPYSISTTCHSLSSSSIGTGTKAYVSYQGSATTTSSGKGIKWTISGIPQNYDKVRLIMIKHTSDGTIEEPPRIYLEEDITASTQTFTAYGTSSAGSVSSAELNEVNAVFQTVQTLDVVKNRMFVGNVEMVDAFEEWDPGNVAFTPFMYEAPSDTIHYENLVSGSGVDQIGHPANGTTVLTGSLIPGQLYLVEGGSINYPSSGGGSSVIADGDTFRCEGYNTRGSNWAGFSTASGSPTVTPIFRRNKFTTWGASTANYDNIKIENDFLDTKGVIGSGFLKGYKRGGEKYRFGILFWSKEMTPLFVRHLADWITPDTGSSSGYTYPLTRVHHTNTTSTQDTLDEVYTMRHLGVQIGSTANPLDLTDICGSTSTPDNVAGFSIVRLPRNKRIIAQGLMSYVAKTKGATATKFSNVFGILNGVCGNDTNEGWDFVHSLWSPEFNFAEDDVQEYLSTHAVRGKVNSYLRCNLIASTPSFTTAEAAVLSHGQPYINRDRNNSNLSNNAKGYVAKLYASTNTTTAPNPLGSEFEIQGLLQTFGTEDGVSVPNSSQALTYNASQIHNTSDTPGTSGKCVICATNGVPKLGGGPETKERHARPLVDIIDENNLNPEYGNIDLGNYISCGHYQPLDSTVYAANGNSWKFKEIEIMGGDIFLNMFDVAATIPTNGVGNSMGMAWSFPVESTINTNLRQGGHPLKNGFQVTSTAITGDTAANEGLHTQFRESFAQQSSYNSEPDTITYQAAPLNFREQTTRGNSVYFSNVKIVGENEDNYIKFPAANERFMDTSSGSITALIAVNDRLYCFQEEGVLFVPVEEAAAITSEVGDQVLIGVSGVIDRYAKQSERYGLQHPGGIILTESGFYWTDLLKNKALHLSRGGGGIKRISLLGIQNELETYLRGSDIQTYINSLDTIGNWYGVSMGYDERYNEVYFTYLSRSDGHRTYGFSELKQRWTGRYPWTSPMYMRHNGLLLSQPPSYLYRYTSPGLDTGRTYTKGDKLIFTNSSGDVQAFKLINTYQPTGSETSLTGEDSFVLLGGINEIHLHDGINSEICKVYGEVFDEYITFIINQDNPLFKRWKAFRIQGNENNHDKITVQTMTHNSGEVDTSDYFVYRMDSWDGPVPLDADGKNRMRGYWMKVTLRHDHATTKGSDFRMQTDGKEIKLISLSSTFNENKKYGL